MDLCGGNASESRIQPMAAQPSEPAFAPIADLTEACELVEQALASAAPRVRAAWDEILATLGES